MLDEQHRHAELAAQLVDERLQIALFLRVQAGGRLVQHEQARLGDHAARDLQASLVAVGQVAGLAVGELAQAHEVQPLRRARQRIGFRLAIGLELEQARQQARLDLGVLGDQQVFQHGQLLEQAHVLERAHQPVARDLVAGRPVMALPSIRISPAVGA